MRNTDLTTNKPRDRRMKVRNTDLNTSKPRDRRLKDEEQGPNNKQIKRQEIER
jgi:hypothetical protein